MVPSAGFDHVGELALDGLIETLQMRKVGVIQTNAVLPSVMPSAFAEFETATAELSLPVEVFSNEHLKLTAVQIRAVVLPSRRKLLARQLVEWAAGLALKEVVVLADSSAHVKNDADLELGDIRWVAGDEEERATLPSELKWENEEEFLKQKVVKGGLLLPFLAYAPAKSLKITALLAMSNPGENLTLASGLLQLAFKYLDTTPAKTNVPASWRYVYATAEAAVRLFN